MDAVKQLTMVKVSDAEKEIAELKQQRDHLESENAKQAEMLNKVIEQRGELQKDAERWTAFRSAGGELTLHLHNSRPDMRDSVIDAAIAKVKP